MKLSFLFSVLFFMLSLGCSVYKSQGRKSFETDTPARVPISLTFRCHHSQALKDQAQTVSFEQLRQMPGLVIKPAIYQETVILLASSPETEHYCFSEGLDLSYYAANQEVFSSQINTWP